MPRTKDDLTTTTPTEIVQPELNQTRLSQAAQKVVQPVLRYIPFGNEDHQRLIDLSADALRAKNRNDYDANATKMANLMLTNGVKKDKVIDTLLFQNSLFDTTLYLRNAGHADQANTLLEGVASGKFRNAEDILTQMSSWGYTDFVRQERDRMVAYEAMIASVVQELTRQQAVRPEEIAQQASQSQQMEIPVIISSLQKFVQETWEKMQDEAVGEKEEKDAERQSARDAEPDEVQEKIKKEVESVVALTTNDFTEKGLAIKTVVSDPQFQDLFDKNRAEELRPLLMTGAVVPAQISSALSEKTDVSDKEPIVQLALVRAYHKALEKYSTVSGKAG